MFTAILPDMGLFMFSYERFQTHICRHCFFYVHSFTRYFKMKCFKFLCPCIMNIGWRERNQQDATNPMLIIKLLSQHVSGIIMPIIRRTRPRTTAFGVLHCLCWLWLCEAASWAVCTVWKLLLTQCKQFTTQPHTTTANTTSAEHHMR